jgi:malate dehydrogenase (oxaloacetate-decarboxylating)(NADP+)
MKLAATLALADIAKKDGVPASVLEAYNVPSLAFGPEYIIPKPLDPRVLVEESVAVAEAALKSGVAGVSDFDLKAYRSRLEKLSETIATR